MSEPIITVSGLRGIVGKSLTPEIAVRYARAFVDGLPPGPLVVTHDGRTTGPELIQAVIDGLAKVGRTCFDGRVAATPTTGILVCQRKAAGGIQITASHNPSPYNGLKLFSAAGRALPASTGAQVLSRYRITNDEVLETHRRGQIILLEDTVAYHAALVAAVVDVEAIRARRFNVLLDANHGAGGRLGERLLAALGCVVTLVGGRADGKFSHPPEPTKKNLVSTAARVRNAGVDIGFCQDPDADRLALIDHDGNYLGEEYTLAICVDHVLRNRQGPVATNLSTSRMTEDLASRYGVPFHRSPVGEANVVDVMLKSRAVLAGEGNGGVIDPRVGLVRDSFVGMALILDAMAARKKSIASLAQELPRYHIEKTTVCLPSQRIAYGLKILERYFSHARPDYMDGLRLDWDDGWLLVRPSNTEPIVRVVCEAGAAQEAQAVCQEVSRLLSQLDS